MEGTNTLTVNQATMNEIVQAWISAKFTGDVTVIGLKKTRGKESFEIELKSPDLIDAAEVQEPPDPPTPSKKATKKK